MKTITKITLLIAIILTLSFNSFATGFNFSNESYINDIPMDLTVVEVQIKYDSAISETFNFQDEEYIDDMQFSETELEALHYYYKAMSESFDFEDEAYIDDIPSEILLSNDYAEIR